jgi:uncharacterized protein YjbJ (UPF0337 family)
MGVLIMLIIFIGFDLGSTASLAAFSQSPQIQIAFMNRADAMAKDIEGRVQETIGKMTDNPQDQIIGKAKQVESQLLNSANDLRDNIDFQAKAKDIEKKIEHKVQSQVY